MENRGFSLQIVTGGVTTTLNFSMTIELAKSLADGDAERLSRHFDVLDAKVEERGFWFVLANDMGEPVKELIFEPKHFGEFMGCFRAVRIPLSVIQRLDTAGAVSILKSFTDWLAHKQAEVFERDIKAGNLTFEEARKINAEVFKVPRFQQFLAERYATDSMPKGRKGKRSTYRREVEELYARACRIYRETPGLSFESACYSATEQRPDLVPSGWRSDPGGNLKREAARYWDQSQYQQKTWREARDR